MLPMKSDHLDTPDMHRPGVKVFQRRQHSCCHPLRAMTTGTPTNANTHHAYNHSPYEPFCAPLPPHTAVVHSLPTLPLLFTHHNMTLCCLKPTYNCIKAQQCRSALPGRTELSLLTSEAKAMSPTQRSDIFISGEGNVLKLIGSSDNGGFRSPLGC